MSPCLWPSASLAVSLMRRVAVPPPHRPPIREITRLAPEVFDRLTQVLAADSKKPLVRSELCTAISNVLEEDTDTASVLLDALLGAHSVRQRKDATSAEVAEAVVSEPALKLSDEERDIGTERLRVLLDLSSLELLARAVQLVAEEGQGYCSVRTLSDLRPVFAPDSDPPSIAGALIRHALKIRFHTESDVHACSVSLDDRGLLEVRDAIDRALAKGRTIRAAAAAAGMRLIEIEDSHS